MKKVWFIILTLIVSLGGLGIAYASWFDTVTISGNVETGSVCLTWVQASNLDGCENWPPPPWVVGIGNGDPNLDLSKWNPQYPNIIAYYRTDKNVACTEIEGIVIGEDNKSITITVKNGYPLYYNDFQVHVCNCGSIPIKLYDLEITETNFTIADKPWESTYGDIWLRVTDGLNAQLEPGDCTAASVEFVIQQRALQNAGRGELGDPPAYTFTISWKAIQWNEF